MDRLDTAALMAREIICVSSSDQLALAQIHVLIDIADSLRVIAERR